VEVVPLSAALHQSDAVFVVERAEPFVHSVPVRKQPRPRRGSNKETIDATYASFEIREVLYFSPISALIRKTDFDAAPPAPRLQLFPSQERGLYQVELPHQPQDLLWLVNSSDPLNAHLTRLRVETGANKIPIYYRLDQGLRLESIVAGEKYLLLARRELSYQSYVGVGGWGLLDIAKQPEVERLLQQEFHVPPLPEYPVISIFPAYAPKTASDGDILETVFRYQTTHNYSEIQEKAAAYCIEVNEGEDLPAEFMSRFRNTPKIQVASSCAAVSQGRCQHIEDVRTHQPALSLQVQSIRRVFPDTVSVVGGFVEYCENLADYEYVLRRYDGRWVIVRTTKVAAT
jgi:hypothetical protein